MKLISGLFFVGSLISGNNFNERYIDNCQNNINIQFLEQESLEKPLKLAINLQLNYDQKIIKLFNITSASIFIVSRSIKEIMKIVGKISSFDKDKSIEDCLLLYLDVLNPVAIVYLNTTVKWEYINITSSAILINSNIGQENNDLASYLMLLEDVELKFSLCNIYLGIIKVKNNFNIQHQKKLIESFFSLYQKESITNMEGVLLIWRFLSNLGTSFNISISTKLKVILFILLLLLLIAISFTLFILIFLIRKIITLLRTTGN